MSRATVVLGELEGNLHGLVQVKGRLRTSCGQDVEEDAPIAYTNGDGHEFDAGSHKNACAACFPDRKATPRNPRHMAEPYRCPVADCECETTWPAGRAKHIKKHERLAQPTNPQGQSPLPTAPKNDEIGESPDGMKQPDGDHTNGNTGDHVVEVAKLIQCAECRQVLDASHAWTSCPSCGHLELVDLDIQDILIPCPSCKGKGALTRKELVL